MNNKTYETDNLQIQDPSLNYNEDDFIDFGNVLLDLISALLRYWYIIVIVSLLCGGFAYGVQKKGYAPSYTSSATVIINVNYGLTYSSPNLNEKIMALLVMNVPNIVSSDALKKSAANELNMSGLPGQISAEEIADTSMYKFTVTSANAQLSFDILQAVLKCFPSVASNIIDTTTLTMVDEPKVPQNPDEPPSYNKFAILGAAGGFAACCVVIVLISLLKKTVRRENDFRRDLDIECLGGVPNISIRRHFKKENQSVLVTERKTDYNFNESLSILCTRIDRDQQEYGSKIYAITSTLPEEGKSTLAINLAYVLSYTGKKVDLIDLDTHNPTILRILGLDETGTSVKDVLEGKTDYEHARIQLEGHNISVLQGSNLSAFPGSILNSDKLSAFIKKSGENADIVLIDTAPIGLYSDVIEVAKYADAVIYVIKQDFVPEIRIKEGIEFLSQCGPRIAGGVLNKAMGGYNDYAGNYNEEETVKTKHTHKSAIL